VTTSELSKVLGARGLFSLALDGGDLKVPVEVLDVKRSYGNTRYKIQPIGGIGSAWVDSSRVTLKGSK
jgi:hypothetical protein